MDIIRYEHVHYNLYVFIYIYIYNIILYTVSYGNKERHSIARQTIHLYEPAPQRFIVFPLLLVEAFIFSQPRRNSRVWTNEVDLLQADPRSLSRIYQISVYQNFMCLSEVDPFFPGFSMGFSWFSCHFSFTSWVTPKRRYHQPPLRCLHSAQVFCTSKLPSKGLAFGGFTSKLRIHEFNIPGLVH